MAEPIRLQCYGCKAAIVGDKTREEICAQPARPVRNAERGKPPLTTREQDDLKLAAYKHDLIAAHWRQMQSPEERKQHRTPMPRPGYDEIEQAVPLRDLIEQCLDRGHTMNAYVEGVRYTAAVVAIPPAQPDARPTQVALALASRVPGHQRAVLDVVKVLPIEDAVDLVMAYDCAFLVGPPDLTFGTFMLDALPEPEDARLTFHLLLDHRQIVLPHIKRLYDPAPKIRTGELLRGGPMATAVEAAASLIAKTLGSRVTVHHTNALSETVAWGLNPKKVRDVLA